MRYLGLVVGMWFAFAGVGAVFAEDGGETGEDWFYYLLSVADQAEYAKYIAAGFRHEQMECWCNPYQCHGDIDDRAETFCNLRVYMGDFDEIIRNWKKRLIDPTLNPYADVDHKGETLFQYRVFIGALNRVI